MKSKLKAVILCAGVGSRALPETQTVPKSLLTINGKPLLWYSVSNLRLAGVDEVCFVVGFGASQIEQFIQKSFRTLKATYIYNEKFATTNSIYSYYLSTPFFLRSHFFRLDGDMLYSKNILRRLLSSKKSPVSAVEKKEKIEGEVSTVAVDRYGRILRFDKDIPKNEAFGEAKGIEYVSASSSFGVADALSDMMKRKLLHVYAEQAYQNIINKGGSIYYKKLQKNDFWCDIDTVEELFSVRQNFTKFI